MWGNRFNPVVGVRRVGAVMRLPLHAPRPRPAHVGDVPKSERKFEEVRGGDNCGDGLLLHGRDRRGPGGSEARLEEVHLRPAAGPARPAHPEGQPVLLRQPVAGGERER